MKIEAPMSASGLLMLCSNLLKDPTTKLLFSPALLSLIGKGLNAFDRPPMVPGKTSVADDCEVGNDWDGGDVAGLREPSPREVFACPEGLFPVGLGPAAMTIVLCAPAGTARVLRTKTPMRRNAAKTF